MWRQTARSFARWDAPRNRLPRAKNDRSGSIPLWRNMLRRTEDSGDDEACGRTPEAGAGSHGITKKKIDRRTDLSENGVSKMVTGGLRAATSTLTGEDWKSARVLRWRRCVLRHAGRRRGTRIGADLRDVGSLHKRKVGGYGRCVVHG